MKTTNEYARLLGDAYDRIPKAVLAALVVSFATHGDPWNTENGGDPLALVMEEWAILHQNGIVPQKPR